jgi:hypothetical protein
MSKVERESILFIEKQTATKRIIECWNASTRGERKAGKAWYPHAYAVACELMPDEPRIGAGVIAALSPRVSWSENIKGARELCKAFDWGFAEAPIVAGLNANRAKAWRILHRQFADSPVECLNAADGGSYKVNRFFANIMGDKTVCTIDVWAARVAIENAPNVVSGNRYLAIESAYQSAAIQIGRISPRDLQAVCWIHARGTTGHAKNDHTAKAGA